MSLPPYLAAMRPLTVHTDRINAIVPGGRCVQWADLLWPHLVVRPRRPRTMPAAVTTRGTPADHHGPMPYVVPCTPREELDMTAVRHNRQPVHTMVSAPRRDLRPWRERRRRRITRLVVALVLAAAVVMGTVIGLMPQSARHLVEGRPVPTEATVNAWAADASGCLTNVVTGAVVCPVVEDAD